MGLEFDCILMTSGGSELKMPRVIHILRRAIVVSILFGSTILSVIAIDTSHWPNHIHGGTAFADIGKAIANEPDFPTHGTDVEKAKYAFSRLPEIESKYGLVAGTGGKWSDLVVGAGRKGDFRDPESVNSLKAFGRGNCAEWSMAFQEVLRGVGVNSTVIYGDYSSEPGFSDGFTGTDTALYVDEVGPDGRKVRRVFDPFRAVYHAQKDGKTVSSQLDRWGDQPLSASDRLGRDKSEDDPWQDYIQKPFVKAAATEQVLPPTTKVRISNTPPSKAVERLIGKWQSQKGTVMFLYKEGSTLTARMVRRSPKLIAYGVPDGSYMFRNGVINIGPPVSIRSTNGYCYAAKSDCAQLGPYTQCVITANVDKTFERIQMSAKNPRYSEKKCRWVTSAAWSTENSTWTKIAE